MERQKIKSLKLLTLGIILGLTLFGLGRLYRRLTVVHFTTDKSQNLLENTFNYPGHYGSVKSTTTMGEKMQKFSLWLAEYRLVFLVTYLCFWAITLFLVIVGIWSYLNTLAKGNQK